jgi:tRNA (guanine37-N1)-methyltransferase
VQIDIVSLFPEYFRGPFDVSILARARQQGLITVNHTDIRAFAHDKHRKVDDRPFGGGPGMVLMPEPVMGALRSVHTPQAHVIYLSPQGRRLDAALCRELALKSHLVLLCGHYEGIDERVIDMAVDQEISIGDYVLPSGCAATVVLLEAVVRFIPGVLGHADAASCDSFETGIFDHPHYTQPRVFEGHEVPPVLYSGDHQKIAAWRHQAALRKTMRARPDLLDGTRTSANSRRACHE